MKLAMQMYVRVCMCVCVRVCVLPNSEPLKTTDPFWPVWPSQSFGRGSQRMGRIQCSSEPYRWSVQLFHYSWPIRLQQGKVGWSRWGVLWWLTQYDELHITAWKKQQTRTFSFSDLNHSEDLVEDMWLGVSVASQGYPGGRVLVSFCFYCHLITVLSNGKSKKVVSGSRWMSVSFKETLQ